MPRLFKRDISVTIARPLSDKALAAQQIPANAIVVTGLRMAFEIEKHTGSEPNVATVMIYNLAEATRAELRRLPLYVRVDAGYDGNLQRLFTGDLRRGSGLSRKDGVLWETRLELGDGERAYQFARVNRSFISGARASSVVDECARSMGVSTNLTPEVSKLLRKEYANGITLEGTASQALSRTLTPLGLSWSIQDGRIQILRTNDVRKDQAIVISQANGMVGEPESGSPPRKGAPPLLNVKTLLEPRITPGGRIKLESERHQGLYRVESVTHTGDTHGDDWHSELECKPL